MFRLTRQQTAPTNTRVNGPRRRSAFTLTEMLVVMGILLVVAGFALVMLNISAENERIRSSARQMQSYLEGARDRAIFSSATAGEPRAVGVRFQLDEQGINDGAGNPRTVRSMIFVQQPAPWDEGNARVDLDTTTMAMEATRLVGTPVGPDPNNPNPGATHWSRLFNTGQLANGSKVFLDGTPYTIVDASMANSEVLIISPPFRNGAVPMVDYKIVLPPQVMPNQEPVFLADRIMIDMNESDLPVNWGNTAPYNEPLDILFGPSGTVVGAASSKGVIHFVLADVEDVSRGRGVGDPNKEGDELVVTVFTRTGHISSHPVFSQADPFLYAESGEVAK